MHVIISNNLTHENALLNERKFDFFLNNFYTTVCFINPLNVIESIHVYLCSRFKITHCKNKHLNFNEID